MEGKPKKPYNILSTKQNIKLKRRKTFDKATDFLRNNFTGQNADNLHVIYK